MVAARAAADYLFGRVNNASNSETQHSLNIPVPHSNRTTVAPGLCLTFNCKPLSLDAISERRFVTCEVFKYHHTVILDKYKTSHTFALDGKSPTHPHSEPTISTEGKQLLMSRGRKKTLDAVGCRIHLRIEAWLKRPNPTIWKVHRAPTSR